VVVNDGSKDQTLEILMQEFDLYESDQPVRLELETASLHGVYTSPTERLIVVDK
jgi:glycosyltransferase involved in cell wall biosynthesis